MKISFILGTRPEAVKLCPLILAIRNHPEFKTDVCVTGQHRQMLDHTMAAFDIIPDTDLNLMIRNQTLGQLASAAIAGIDEYLIRTQPELVIVQGDTTTVLAASLAAFYQHIPVGHVEAGLRTWNMHSPWPEEANRVLVSKLAAYHFAPTASNRENLLKENVPDKKIFVVGNTVIDALLLAMAKVKTSCPYIPGLPAELQPSLRGDTRRMVLITGHRRENFGQGLENICDAILQLSKSFPEIQFVYPVHLNPNVKGPVESMLSAGDAGNIFLLEPQPYLSFVALMNQAYLILSDSGGIQEEAASINKPVLVMRATTERPEAVASGAVKLVGTDRMQIVNSVSELLLNQQAYEAMRNIKNPYGDGQASERIVAVLQDIRQRKTQGKGI